MFFSNSYSETALEQAAHWIRFLDNLQFLLEEVHSADLQDELLRFYENSNLDAFNVNKISSARNFLLFQNGIILKILEHCFDGTSSDFKKFEKEAIIKAGDYGFMMKFGKTLYKDYVKGKANYSEYKNSGIKWAAEFYIPIIIDQQLSLEEIEDQLNVIDESEIDESEIDENEIDENEIDENFEDGRKSEEIFGETGIGDYKIIEEKNYENFLSNLIDNERERYELYFDLWELEISGCGGSVYNEDYWNKTKGLNFKEYETFPKDLIHLRHEYQVYQTKTDYNLLFAIPNLIFEIFNSCNFDTEIIVGIPVHTDISKNSYYPNYAYHSFFKFRDLCLKNKLSFENIGYNFPEFGRLTIDPNLEFRLIVNLNVSDDVSITLFDQPISTWLKSCKEFENNYSEKEKFQPKNEEQTALILQEIISIEKELAEEFKNITYPGYFGLMGLRENLDNEFSYQNKYFSGFKYAKDNYLKNNTYTHNEILNILTKAKLDYYGYTADDDGQHDHYFKYGSDFISSQNAFYEKTGSYFDVFDIKVLKNLEQKGIMLDPSKIKKGLGICPITVSTALRLERLLAPYLLSFEKIQDFRKLREPIKDEFSLRLEELSW